MVGKLENENKSPGYIIGLVKAIKSWLRYNDVTLSRRIKVRNSTATPTIENEQVPSKEELARVLRTAPLRVKVAIVLIAFADLRPQTLGNDDGSDGLTIKDFPELKMESGKVTFEKVPTTIIVRSNISKARHKYFTFLSNEGCTYLKEYLEERLRSEEELTPETPLIGHDRPRISTKPFMLTRKITQLIRQNLRDAGIRKRPYVLRAYAESQLIIAESKGAISHPYLQFIAGHKGDIEARYSTNKGRLPPEMIEDMRQAYARSQEYLETVKPETTEEKIRETFKKQILGIAGFSAEEIEKLNVENLTDEELQTLVRKRLLGERADDCGRQKVVTLNDVENHLSDGWEYVATLPNGRVIVRLQS